MAYKKKGLTAGPTASESSGYLHAHNNNSYCDKIQAIKQQCKGHWRKIISHLAPELQNAITHHSHHVPCPVHGGKDGLRTFADFDDTGGVVCNTCGAMPDGIDVLQWSNDWKLNETLNQLEQCLENIELLPELNSEVLTNHYSDTSENFRTIMVQRILDELIPLSAVESAPALDYLKNRGLSLQEVPSHLFFHPNLYYQGVIPCSFPALVALITDISGEIVGLHRTYITGQGLKAPVITPKMMLSISHGSTAGASIKLFPATETLAVAEGIETALAVHEGAGLPVWATATATGMGNLFVPETVKGVSIWFDSDRSKTGEKAAFKLANRLIREGKIVRLLKPSIPIPEGGKGVDWLDELNSLGGANAHTSL